MMETVIASTARTPIGTSIREARISLFERIGLLIRAVAITVLASAAAHAQSVFPTRPVTAVVPFAPGGVTDIMARSLSQEFQSATGQPLVVVNKPGGTGVIAAQFVRTAAPDGYTVLIGTGSLMSVLPALKSNPPFDAEKDFIAISLLGITPYVLLVNSSVTAKTLPELIALLQANPGKFNYSTSGFGSLPHLAGEMFKQMAKVEMTHVPYQGNNPATTAAVSGVVEITLDSPMSSLPHVQAGTLRALAVASGQPLDAFPGVPTVGSVLPGFLAESWLCLYVAAGTPPTIVDRLREITGQAIQRPQFLQTAQTGAFRVPRLSADEMAKFLRDDAARWREVAKSANIVVE
jgi:tripartite-type tricarboxylate transporter receptor subunit TctC